MSDPTSGSRSGSSSLEDRLFEAARLGTLETLTALLDRYPEKLQARNEPYEHTLLHLAAFGGHLAAVDLLLSRGLDVNAREKGDNTYAMHWAAAAGHLDVVRRLADAGGDVVGHGDDHGLEVIGWATCWNGSDDAAHRTIAEFLVARGARHHIFSAIAMGLDTEVRRIVADDASTLAKPMSHNEDFQRPLHFAVRMNRPAMVALLLELGADPLATDGSGYPAAAYAVAPEVDRSVMEMIRARGTMDLFTALALGEWDAAARLLDIDQRMLHPGGTSAGVLHLMSKRGDTAAVRWLLERGANPSARWSHWDADVTPLHLAALGNHPDVVHLLLRAGADPGIRDSRHDSDAMGWAVFFQRPEIVRILASHAAGPAGESR